VDWLPGVDDETVEQELRTSWPRWLAASLVVAVVFAAVGALLTWVLGAGWVHGAITGFVMVLTTLAVTRVQALSRARRDQQ
jgi:FtsH-binding integral membrane protein